MTGAFADADRRTIIGRMRVAAATIQRVYIVSAAYTIRPTAPSAAFRIASMFRR
jgi:hypothetical protein